jgi:hypothetical protein
MQNPDPAKNQTENTIDLNAIRVDIAV